MSNDPVNAAAGRRGCGALFGFLLAGLAFVLGFAWFSYRLSLFSGALAIGVLLLALGSFTRSSARVLSQRLLGAGTVLVLVPCLFRLVLVRGSEQTKLTTLPADSGASFLSRLYPESDGTLAMAGLLGATASLRDPEAARFVEILSAAYERADPDATLQPTPAIGTYLGQQSPRGFDAIVIRPPEQRVAADGAVVFLHGYAGSFYVYCWEMAQAASAANLVTLCPATGPNGAWWDDDGTEILRLTLKHAHGIGMNRVYLAGLSNGAAGASVLASKFQRSLAGLVLISGGRAETPPTLPVLVVQGEKDMMMLASHARTYASRGRNVTYHEVPGGHFVFLSDVDRVRPAIAQFLLTLEKAATALPKRQ
jgi:pimeloyl-ACP methyl ester carboxylesterase